MIPCSPSSPSRTRGHGAIDLRPASLPITAERQRAFIAHLAATGIVTQAAKHIGASLEALYKLRKRPGAEEFDAAWDAAVDRGVARLEDCASLSAYRFAT